MQHQTRPRQSAPLPLTTLSPRPPWRVLLVDETAEKVQCRHDRPATERRSEPPAPRQPTGSAARDPGSAVCVRRNRHGHTGPGDGSLGGYGEAIAAVVNERVHLGHCLTHTKLRQAAGRGAPGTSRIAPPAGGGGCRRTLVAEGDLPDWLSQRPRVRGRSTTCGSGPSTQLGKVRTARAGALRRRGP
jgi:hypothetical protein